MKPRNPVTVAALAALFCIILLAAPVTAARKTVGTNDQIHSLNYFKAVPNQLNYQGYLADAADSSAVTATLEMTFRLFDSETKGSELWSETHSIVAVSEGLFQVLLGSMTPFPDGLFDGSEVWLQTEVGVEVLTPRKPLVSTAYSHRTNSAEMLEDNTLTDLDNRWVNEEDLDHLDAADGDPAEAVYVDGDGKVGIGTTSPSHPLDVNGAVGATTYYGDGSNLTGISGTTDNDWTIDGDNVYHQTGNVGIGTASPSAKLDVDGEVNTDSLYKIGGSTVLSIQGSQNVFVGAGAGGNNAGGYATFVGAYAGFNNQGGDNVFMGRRAGYNNSTGGSNTYLGQVAGYSNTDGSSNTFLGSATGYKNTTGNDNTFLGRHAGYSNITGSGNVFVGYRAGYYETGSDKLYIANGKDSSDVLIFGEFSTGNVGIGTQSPDAKLHVVGDAGNYGYMGSSSYGVYGRHGSSGNYGRLGSSGSGVSGQHGSSGNFGQLGSSYNGVYGQHAESGNWGYLGGNSYAVYASHDSSGNHGRLASNATGVYGMHGVSGNYGYLGGSDRGVFGSSSSGYAGYFQGDVHITGTLTGGKTVIDHPLDPENKLLRHNFVESPENLLIYRGKTRLDGRGEAVVEMPDYFDALTKEVEATVNLTPMGRSKSPSRYEFSYEWKSNHRSFHIYGEPDREISWMVLADRDDPVIHQLAQPVEQEKGPDNKLCNRGELLYPTAYGYPESMGKDYKERQEMEKLERKAANDVKGID